jgi:hypothetical protein
MLFSVAEKLMLKVGYYPCQWTYRGQMISGQLWLEGSQAPTGEMFEAPGTWAEGTAEVLRGRLRHGYDTALLDVSIEHMLLQRSWLQARVALIYGSCSS